MHRFRKERLEAPESTGASPQQADRTSPGLNNTDADISSSPSPTDVEKDHVLMYGKQHAWDPNMDQEKLSTINQAIELQESDSEKAIAQQLEESPYPEVNSAVPLGDDPSIPANTIRAWFLGMLFVTFGSGLNMLFSLRQPSIQITSIVAQLCAYPIGCAMAKWLPTRRFSFFGIPWTLNPGPFNKKEHCLITVMANVSFGGGAAYSTLTIEAMRGFYGINWGVGFGILFTLCTQLTGLGLAGLFRKWLVTPSAMIWPVILPNCALFQTLHEGNAASDPATTNGWRISRFKFFNYVLIGGFLWYFFPGYLFRKSSSFYAGFPELIACRGLEYYCVGHLDQAQKCLGQSAVWRIQWHVAVSSVGLYLGLDHGCQLYFESSYGTMARDCKHDDWHSLLHLDCSGSNQLFRKMVLGLPSFQRQLLIHEYGYALQSEEYSYQGLYTRSTEVQELQPHLLEHHVRSAVRTQFRHNHFCRCPYSSLQWQRNLASCSKCEQRTARLSYATHEAELP